MINQNLVSLIFIENVGVKPIIPPRRLLSYAPFATALQIHNF